ncbi:20380_t:CDS:2, partial [Racocetra persica]
VFSLLLSNAKKNNQLMCIISSILVTPSKLVASEDITVEIIKQLTQSPGQLPYKSDLANFLNENPPVKIPLSPDHYYQFSTT